MITVPAGVKIYLACGVTDMRKGFDGLSILASNLRQNLDEAFVPTEWDEADLAYRIREAGWKVATCGYERLGGYEHLGSSTLGTLSDAYKARVLKNGLLFHQRWAALIARDHARPRRTWRRQITREGLLRTLVKAAGRVVATGSS